MAISHLPDDRVAVLVDCDNITPDALPYALRVVAQFGRVVVRRGYGNGPTLSGRWEDMLVQQAFTPSLQYAFASGKNTSDIALALDAMELLFDDRAHTFCLVTSDSDFAHLCRKLRERGAHVLIVGEAKTPATLRNASDQFFEWVPPAPEASDMAKAVVTPSTTPSSANAKRRPRALVDAVSLLAAETPDGKVHLGQLGSYLRRADPSFSPQVYGHTGLLNMIRTYDLLTLTQETGGHWTVRLAEGPAS